MSTRRNKRSNGKYETFVRLYWAIKRYEDEESGYKKNPKYIYKHRTWEEWTSNKELREFIISKANYDLFWKNHNREVDKELNEAFWGTISNDDYYFFNLTCLFFENNGDIWKTHDDIKDMFDLNFLFRNFSLRPSECEDCCELVEGPFESDFDLCMICDCCYFLWEFYNSIDNK